MHAAYNKINYLRNESLPETNSTINYNFFFISLISPFLTTNVRLLSFIPHTDKKAFIKQSYILLTWFYYLSFIVLKNKDKSTKNRLKIFILPLYRRKFTLTRAPMAHKNWSKEQYKFQFYKFKISFNAFLKDSNPMSTLDAGLLFALLSKKFFPHFESNVLFVKSCSTMFYVSDKRFFSYYNFINK